MAEQYNIENHQRSAAVAGSLRFGAEQDFFTDAGSMKFGPFVEFYDLNFKEVLHVDIMLKYKAIEEGSYEVMVVYATDGLNKRANLKILEDDKQFFPEYYGTILARNDLFERFREEAPDLEETLSSLNGLFTNDLMSSMTYEVDVEQRSVDDVAREFLIEQGLLAPWKENRVDIPVHSVLFSLPATSSVVDRKTGRSFTESLPVSLDFYF